MHHRAPDFGLPLEAPKMNRWLVLRPLRVGNFFSYGKIPSRERTHPLE
jgi:hypothetical protein